MRQTKTRSDKIAAQLTLPEQVELIILDGRENRLDLPLEIQIVGGRSGVDPEPPHFDLLAVPLEVCLERHRLCHLDSRRCYTETNVTIN